jgi:hypothetical protein
LRREFPGYHKPPPGVKFPHPSRYRQGQPVSPDIFDCNRRSAVKGGEKISPFVLKIKRIVEEVQGEIYARKTINEIRGGDRWG